MERRVTARDINHISHGRHSVLNTFWKFRWPTQRKHRRLTKRSCDPHYPLNFAVRLCSQRRGICNLATGPERRQPEAMRSERLSNLIGTTIPMFALEGA
jgi:hypothetical protein